MEGNRESDLQEVKCKKVKLHEKDTFQRNKKKKTTKNLMKVNLGGSRAWNRWITVIIFGT